MAYKSLFSPPVLLIALMVCLGAIYAWNSAGETMFDDEQEINYVTSFSSIGSTFTVDCFGFFRPVKNLIFYAWALLLPGNYQAWRLSAIAAFVGLIPVVYLFFGLFFKERSWQQILATALWASAPSMTAVVCWMSSTNINLGGYGFGLYFLFYEKAQKDQVTGKIGLAYSWLFVALLTLAFACFSYEAAMAAPFLLLFKDFVKHCDRLKDKRTWMFFFLSLLTLSLYFLLRNNHGGVTNIAELATIPTKSDLWVSLSSGWFYIIHAVRWLFPFGMQGILIVFDPDQHKLLVLVSVAVVLGIGVTLLIFRNKSPLLFLGLGWYALALFPMSNVIPLRNGPICDYYLFLPGLGLAIFICWLLQCLLAANNKKWLLAIPTLWIFAFLVTTSHWSYNWKSKKAISEATLSWQSENHISLGTLAKAEMEAGNYESAEAYLKEGLRISPWYSPLYYQQIILLTRQRKFDEAIATLKDMIEKQSNLAKPFVILAYVYDIHFEKWQEAEKLLMTALEKPWDPQYSKAGAINLAYIYYRTGRIQFALKVYESLIEKYPSNPEILDKYQSMKAMDKTETDVQDPTESL